MLLESLETELTEYYEDLIDTLEEKATTVAIASVFDAITALTGITLSDVDDVYDLVDAITVIATYDTNLASAQADYDEAVEAYDAYVLENDPGDEPTEVEIPVWYENLAAAITEEDIQDIVDDYSSSLTGTLDVEGITTVLQSGDITQFTSLSSYYSGYTPSIFGGISISDGIYLASILTDVLELYYDTISGAYTDADEYSTALEEYTDYITEKEDWDEENSEYLEELTAYETAVSTANSAVTAVTTEYSSAYATLVSLGISNADSFADIDLDNISFIVDVVSLLTEFDTTDMTAISDLITDLEELAEEYEMEETIEQLIEDIIANIEAEFNEEFLLEEAENLETAVTDAITTFESLLGTDGYPASPEDKIQEIIEEVISVLEETVTDDEYDDLINALESLIDYENFETIAIEIYTELAEYILTGEATVEGIQDIIVNEIYENIMSTLVELMDIEVAYIELAEITVNDGYVGNIYAYGADEGDIM